MYKKVKERVNKKWAFVSLSVLVSGLVFTAMTATAVIPLSKDSPTLNEPDSAYLEKHASGVNNYDITYPVLRAEKIDMALRNYTSHRVDAFWQELDDKKLDPRNYLTIRYTLLHYGARFATIAFHEQQQFTDKPAVSQQTLLSFDLKTQKQVTIDDLFLDKKAGEILLGRMIGDYFAQELPGQFSPAELRQYQAFSLDAMSDFALGDKTITFYLDPRQSHTNQDTQTISVKKDLLTGVLNPVIAKTDTSQIEVASSDSTYQITTMPRHDVPIDPNKKMLALTFDDGPGPLTPQVLDALRQYGARATFFVIGRQVPTYASIVKREVADGHEVGNHTWDHPKLTLLAPGALQQQIDRTQDAIVQATGGYKPTLLRPPQGVYNDAVAAFAQTRGMGMALWNVDTNDWLNRDAEIIYQRIIASAGDGRIILVHDIHPTSVAATIRAIPDLISQGYQLVTFSQLDQYR
jgi:peptidoglycan-N-acetylglucosamine deacetylase